MKSLRLLAIFSFSAFSICQTSHTSPQLTLKLVIEKDSFRVGERVKATFELRNVSSRTLCIPLPDQQCTRGETGSLIFEGLKLDTTEQDIFICHVDGRGISGNELESEIRNHSIRLQPNAVYRVKAEKSKYVALDAPGRWQLEARYLPPHPPKASLNEVSSLRERAVAQRSGCTIPDSSVAAEPVPIAVTK